MDEISEISHMQCLAIMGRLLLVPKLGHSQVAHTNQHCLTEGCITVTLNHSIIPVSVYYVKVMGGKYL